MAYEMGNFGQTSTNSVTEARLKINELTSLQKRVDEGLRNMPEGPEKQRLLKIRDESRGVFSKYILPAWNRIKDMVGGAFGDIDHDEAMGIIPLIPIAAVTAATAMLGYVGNSILMERRILNDPSFTAAQKTQLLSSGGLQSLVGLTSNIKTLAILAVVGYVAFRYFASRQRNA